MAENETLDIRTSPRWIAVIRSIRNREVSANVEHCIKEALAKSWNNINKQFRKAGFSLLQLLTTVSEGDTALIEKAYRDSKYHRFVPLIAKCKGFMDNPADMMERAINSQLRIVRDQIRDNLVSRGDYPTFAEADAAVTGAFAKVSPDVAAFARRLVDAPQRAAKLLVETRPSDMPVPSMIHVSLINPAAPPVGIGR